MPKGIYKRSAALRKRLADHMRRVTRAKPGLRLSDSEKEKLRLANLGRKLSENHRHKLSVSHMGLPGYWTGKKRGPMPPQTRAALSLANKGNQYSKGLSPAHIKPIWYRRTRFRSSWELRFAKALSSRGMKWRYEPKRFNLGECTYCPDFYVPETGAYWEVKGWLNSSAKRKIGLFRSLFPDLPLVVVTEQVLNRMEV